MTNVRGNAKVVGPGLTDNVMPAPLGARPEAPEPEPQEVSEVTTLQRSPLSTRAQREAAETAPTPAHAEFMHRANTEKALDQHSAQLADAILPPRVRDSPMGVRETIRLKGYIQEAMAPHYTEPHDMPPDAALRQVASRFYRPSEHPAGGDPHARNINTLRRVFKKPGGTRIQQEPESEPNIVHHEPERIVTREPSGGDPGAIEFGEPQDIPTRGGSPFPVDYVSSGNTGEQSTQPANPPSQAGAQALESAARVGAGAALKPEHVMYARERKTGGVDVFTNENAFRENQPHDSSRRGTGSALNNYDDQIQTEVHSRLQRAVPDNTVFARRSGSYTGADAPARGDQPWVGRERIPDHPHNAELENLASQRWDTNKPRLLFMARAHAMAADPDLGIGDVSKLQPHHIEMIANSVATKHPFNAETLSYQEQHQRDATNRALDAGKTLTGIMSAHDAAEAKRNIATSNALQRARRSEVEETAVGELERHPETGRLPGSPNAFPAASVDADTRSAEESTDAQLRNIANTEYSEQMNAPEDVVEGRTGSIASDALDISHDREFGAAETQMHLTQIRHAIAEGRDPNEVIAGLRAASAAGGYSIVEASGKKGFKPALNQFNFVHDPDTGEMLKDEEGNPITEEGASRPVTKGKSSIGKEAFAGAQKETQRFLAANKETVRGMKKAERKSLKKRTRATENARSAKVVAQQMRDDRIASEAKGEAYRASVPPEVQAAQMASSIENDKWLGGPTRLTPSPNVPETVLDSEGNNRLVTQVPVEPGSRQPRAPWAPRNPETKRALGTANPRRPAGQTSVTQLTAVGEALAAREIGQRLERVARSPRHQAARAASNAYAEAIKNTHRAEQSGDPEAMAAAAEAEEAARRTHDIHQRDISR